VLLGVGFRINSNYDHLHNFAKCGSCREGELRGGSCDRPVINLFSAPFLDTSESGPLSHIFVIEIARGRSGDFPNLPLIWRYIPFVLGWRCDFILQFLRYFFHAPATSRLHNYYPPCLLTSRTLVSSLHTASYENTSASISSSFHANGSSSARP
jgi:hypothetical protein